jgi:hypothetical protein
MSLHIDWTTGHARLGPESRGYPIKERREMRFRLLVLLVLMALLVVPFAGCGGSDEGADSQATTDGAQSAADKGATETVLQDEGAAATENEATAAPVSEDQGSTTSPEVAALDSLDSYRQTMTTRSVSGDEVSEWTVVTEYVREPSAMRTVWTSVDANGNKVTSWETIQIGTTTYMRGDESQGGSAEWVSYTSGDAEEPQGSADITNWMSTANYLDDPNCKRKGNDDVDGQAAVLYVCEQGVFGAYSGIWGATGQLISGSVQTWVSKEYDVPLRSISEWVGEDNDKVRQEYYSEASITDINESITIEAPEGVSAPGLPEDVPLYPEAAITLAMAGMVGFEVEAEMADVISFYKEQMVAGGWTLDTDGGEMLSFSREARTATIMLSADETKISGSIIVQ